MRVLLGVLIVCAAAGTSLGAVMSPDYFLPVSLDGDRDDPGTVNAGSVGSSPLIVRERADLSQEALRIATFLHFDTGALSLPDSVESATFSVSFDQRLNTVNNMAVNVGRVQDDGTNGDTWDASLAAGTVPLFEWGMASADALAVVPNAKSSPFGTYSVDVTNIVNKWASGTNANNGLVLYGPTAVFQAAGLDNATLSVVIPEPSTFLIWSLGLLGLIGWRRRKR